MTLLALDPLPDVSDAADQDDAVECIACDCSPMVMLCGRYDSESSFVEGEVCADNACPDCYQVWLTGCPRCGCGRGETCSRCEVAE